MEIPLFNTYIHPSAKEKVTKVLDSTFISEGKLVKEFEDKLADTLGCVNPIALNSGTSALHLAVVLAGVGPGDEVILPAQTFIATGLAILYCGATPVFADIQYETGNIDPKSVREKITPRTKAVITVHWMGYPCDMDEINIIAKEHNLKVIEDAAHAPGAIYKNQPIGSISDFTCFSFQAIKHLTTGDGGALCVKDPKLAKLGMALRWFDIDRANTKPSILGERGYDADMVGYKYHMNDYSAALGLANLENFNERLENRRKLAKRYRDGLSGIAEIKIMEESNDRISSYWTICIHVPEKREDFIMALKSRGIPTTVHYLGIDRNKILGGKNINLKNQRKFDETQIHLPLHDAMNDQSVDFVIDAIKSGW
jgi:perosamine synthetase